MPSAADAHALLKRVLDIYDQKDVALALGKANPGRWTRETINRWNKGKAYPELNKAEYRALLGLLPKPSNREHAFDFIDLFAGIGGLRRAFESIGGRCRLTSEWNKQAVRTYKANYDCNPAIHKFNDDIRDLTLTNEDVTEREADDFIRKHVPDHDVLLAGFPCQPFSIAGVSKKNALGRAHGFECTAQGTLFFDVVRILRAKKPPVFVLENVKNLKSHDKGNTFKVIRETLEHLGYVIADIDVSGKSDPKIIDGQHFVPQHRERIVLVGFLEKLDAHRRFTLGEVASHYPKKKPLLRDILEPAVDSKYVLTPKLWDYLYHYAITHKKKGNGFGYGLVTGDSVTRTLSARYYKDGSEILVDRGFDPSQPIDSPDNVQNRPRRLTPRECARLMGYDKKNGPEFRIPVSDTQAYKQFGNSVVVPVFEAVARIMKPRILLAKKKNDALGGARSSVTHKKKVVKRVTPGSKKPVPRVSAKPRKRA